MLRYIALHFLSLQFVRLTSQWVVFYKSMDESLIYSTCFLVKFLKRERQLGEHSVKVHSGKYSTWYVKRNSSYSWVWWYQNKLIYGIALLVCFFYLLVLLEFYNGKKQYKMFFITFSTPVLLHIIL